MYGNKYAIEKLEKCRSSKTKDGRIYIWYDQPYNLYFEEEQALAYLEMIDKEKFSKTLHDPIVKLVEEYSPDIIKGDLHKIEFYDLGPGLPTKTIPLIKEIQNKGISLKYIPVDISQSFLEITRKEMSKFGIKSHGINALFEELPLLLKPKEEKINRIFQIGLTFNNYRPKQILDLLRTLSDLSDFSLIITEIYKSNKKQSLLLPYQDIYAERFNFLALKLLGFKKKDFRYHTQYRVQRIEMGFCPKRNIEIGNLKLTENHKIVTAISYRYTKHSLTKYILDYFHNFEIFQKGDLVIFKLKE